MKKVFLAFIQSIVIFSGCIGCFDEHDEKPSLRRKLDKDYEFVIGHVMPDEDRTYPIEVFVGRLLVPRPDTLNNANIQETLLKIQLRQFQNEYLSTLSYHDDAQVFITAGDQTIELQYVGRGTYRDIANALHISNLQTCSLKVIRPGGKIYQALVTVPGNISITNVKSGDTIIAYPKKEKVTQNLCFAGPPVYGNDVANAYFYRFQQVDDFFSFDERLVFLTFTNSFGSPLNLFECTDSYYNHVLWTSTAFDTVLSHAWGLGETTGARDDMIDTVSYWKYDAPITDRSNITDQKGKKIAGYFGSYNSVSINFVVKAMNDSCTCD